MTVLQGSPKQLLLSSQKNTKYVDTPILCTIKVNFHFTSSFVFVRRKKWCKPT